ncbi:hypothetical protein PO909_018149 [Leuciscus waleckii]
MDFGDDVLKDMFRHGLDHRIYYRTPGNTPYYTLAQYIDCALLLSGSSFTVGFADEKPRKLTVSSKPEPVHVMPPLMLATPVLTLLASAFTPELHPVMAAAEPESLHVGPAEPESLHVGPAEPESLRVGPAEPESLHVGPAEPESLHLGPAEPESLHVTSRRSCRA